jgi:hypothetical protein
MIDPATRWFKTKDDKNIDAFTVATGVEEAWFNCYQWPTEIIFDRCSEFMDAFGTIVSNDYAKSIRQCNSQTNASNHWKYH